MEEFGETNWKNMAASMFDTFNREIRNERIGSRYGVIKSFLMILTRVLVTFHRILRLILEITIEDSQIVRESVRNLQKRFSLNSSRWNRKWHSKHNVNVIIAKMKPFPVDKLRKNIESECRLNYWWLERKRLGSLKVNYILFKRRAES